MYEYIDKVCSDTTCFHSNPLIQFIDKVRFVTSSLLSFFFFFYSWMKRVHIFFLQKLHFKMFNGTFQNSISRHLNFLRAFHFQSSLPLFFLHLPTNTEESRCQGRTFLLYVITQSLLLCKDEVIQLNLSKINCEQFPDAFLHLQISYSHCITLFPFVFQLNKDGVVCF